MEVRPEIRADERAIGEVHRLAFAREDEAQLVAALRVGETYLPELSLVALRAGRVVGHVLVTLVDLVPAGGESGATRPVLALAPLAVRPDTQGRGVGRALVEAALRRAAVRAEPLVAVLGDAGYYHRFGFVPASTLGIQPPVAVADGTFQVRRLPAFRSAVAGVIRYPPAFSGVWSNPGAGGA
ncbi:MAG: N-acetyltransferase [Actinobacteria bacterium]|nr:N-acetyltransferase [Actinomycetota bacterium]